MLSRFSDFFETRMEETVVSGSKGIVLKEQFKNNIWYIIFFFAFYGNRSPEPLFDSESLFPLISTDSPLWMDVESYIKRIMTSKDSRIRKYISAVGEKTYIDVFELACSGKADYSNYLYRRTQFRELKSHFSRNDSIRRNKTMAEYLFYELQLFENDFKAYLLKETKEKENEYKTQSQALLKKLKERNSENLYILSFNYTKPNTSKYDIMNHVHGDLRNRVIIGYDSSEINSADNPYLMLTKGWQKLFDGTKDNSLPDKDSINCIKVYGHSLGEQDYSYFHALFDYYDVYSRDISLVFYYTEYEDTPEKNEKIRANYISKVYTLLDKYVLESEKENKRRTFVSRLQLENRLKIKKI